MGPFLKFLKIAIIFACAVATVGMFFMLMLVLLILGSRPEHAPYISAAGVVLMWLGALLPARKEKKT